MIPNSNPIPLFFSLQPERKKRKGTQPCLGKPVRKLDFSLLLLSENLIWNPEILPPCWKIRICLALLCPSAGCSCFVGVICSGFGSVSFSPALAAGFSPNQARFCLLISVSIEIECSVLCE
ncbi:hypothetical protein SLEP1_g27674 [Rubroshorea leprosula]|uniref:Uncharacterized protein n=1 Tax=Rubroshorea leprosula TaxID=152421 RepID=A0AAV5JZV8_9ROSI|nr:hypothetical protein SLEP1_g27674 [Rubroshorea leprosula]